MLTRRGLFGAITGLALTPVALHAQGPKTIKARGRFRWHGRRYHVGSVTAHDYQVLISDDVYEKCGERMLFGDRIGVEFKLPDDPNDYTSDLVALRIWKLT